ncbi:MAG TPA: cation-transporting P-type ATPase [Candidatus Saccharimonadales bacterium]|nr:cation-transporting P-type ATPase [Candidatus Saccharimonadales bacterium]
MADQKLLFYRLDPSEVFRSLGTKAEGLSAKEAGARLAQQGSNQLARVKRQPPLFIFVRQFRNLLVVILLTSAAFSTYLHDLKTAIILLFIAMINAMVGFVQEYKAESLMASLERLVVPKAKVLRDGKLEEVNSTNVVRGDVVYVEEGDSVPADLRIFQEEELATNDFALTGESNPTRKFVHAISGDVALGNRHNLIFMGTTVALGHGYGVVVGTGMDSELGRIANLSQSTKTDTSPLQREMNNLATRLAQGTLILAAVLLLIALKSHFGFKEALLFAIGISAAMIPNGLIAEVNITLAQTASKMARAKALIKKLSAVETLGATNFICTDKTGTLTKNEMTVERMLIGKTHYQVSGTGYETNGRIQDKDGKNLGGKQLATLDLFFATGAMASNAHVNPPDKEHATWYCVGDPTEGALITLARKATIDPAALDKKYPEIKEFQFDSARKRMSSVRKKDGEVWVFMKGAPESVLERSTTIWDHGRTRKLTTKDRHALLKYNEERAGEAMRNLAFAYSILPKGSKPKKMKFDEVEKNMAFMGIVSMVDPIREQVPAAMQAAQDAHIKVSIITGDYPTTAEAIAQKAGLRSDSGTINIVLGSDLGRLSDAKILQFVKQGGTVFSRVAPEDKLRIVELIKKHGKVVAVTGDGINDAPALKRADIGVAMGKTGTDVAKQASDIILLDDSFGTLVGAIEQGRLTFRNIRKAARCALTDNAGELITVLAGLAAQTLFHVPIAITAIQILAIDVIAQVFPITALGWDPAQGELMKDRPRNLRDHIINLAAVREFIGYGFLAAGLAYCNFLFFFARHNLSPMYFSTTNELYGHATILTYLTIVLCQFMNLLLVRTDHREPFFSSYLWSNKKLLVAFGFSFFCIFNIIYNPLVQPYFAAGPLDLADWLLALAAALLYLTIRLVLRSGRKHSRAAVVELHRQVHGPHARPQF